MPSHFERNGYLPTADGLATMIGRGRLVRPRRINVYPTPGVGENVHGTTQTAFFAFAVSATEMAYRDTFSGQSFTEEDAVSDIELRHFPETQHLFTKMVNIIQRNSTRRGR